MPTPTNYQRTTGGHLRWQPPTPEHLQEMLPTYEILSILGQGGTGAVYKGRQKSLDRIVAIKILPPEAAEDDMQFVERFKNEARTMAKMNHPAIVHVYDFGETTEGQLYIVMEFIDGTDVAKMIQSKGKLPEDYSLSITAHVCDALGYAHTHGVVHRDIKPANILINMEGQVKVADFGLAKATDPKELGLTKTNMAMGTPDFVSPEALMPGVPLDGRADLYAVGVMLYNMLTGTIPRGAFRMPSATLQTDARFDKIILKAMEMDRELRYQTALDLRRDLDVILTAPQVKSGGAAQAAVPQQSLPQKPMGKSPGAPQQRKEAAPPAKPASQPAAKVVAPAKKSNAGVIYGIAAAVVVVAVAAFMLSSGGKKPPAKAAMQNAEAKTTKPEPKPAPTPNNPKTTPSVKPVSVPTPSLLSGSEKWVDGLAQWFGGTKTNEGFTRKPGEAVRVAKFSTMMPLPDSAPLMRDMAVRAKVRLGDGQETTEFRLSARTAVNAAGNPSSYNVKIELKEQRVRLGCHVPGKTYQAFVDYKLPADFDFTAPHTLELRAVGDLLTVTLDGRKLGEHRDTQLPAGHPALAGSKAWIESFEYLNLDSGAAAPAVAATPTPGNAVLTFAGHRYQLVKEKLKWNNAKARAEAMGGHLATITNKEENEWVWGQLVSKLRKTDADGDGDRCFIGGFKRESPDAVWEWVSTDEPFSVQPWMDDFPNDNDIGEKAIAMISGKRWDDVIQLKKSYFFLVEWDDDGTKKPAPSAPAATAPPLTAPVNLLALVDVKRDAVKGKWEMKPEGLVLNLTNGAQLLSLNHPAPEQYDFEIEFTLKEGIKEVGQILPLPTGPIMWKMGIGGSRSPTSFCLGPNLDGKDANKDTARTEALVRRPRLSAGQRYRSVVEVRRGSLRALIDGEEILKWTGDPKHLSNSTEFALPNAAHIGLASYNTAMIFHKAELRPVAAGREAAPQPPPTAVGNSAPPKMPMITVTPTAPADPRLAQLEAGYQARYDSDAQKPFLAAVAALNQSYVANGIARARVAAQAKGSLADVTALDAEKAAIEKGSGVPAEEAADTPESLKALRSTYRGALTKITAERDAKAAPLLALYLKALDAYIAELTKAGKIDEAKQVQALRDAKASLKPVEQAKTAAPPPAATADDPTTPKMSEREVAVWMLSMGSEISVVGTSSIKDVASLPTGKITITTGTIYCDKTTNAELGCLAVCRDMINLSFRGRFLDQSVINLEPIRRLTKLKSLTCYPLPDSTGMEIIAGLKGLTQLTLGTTEAGVLDKIAILKDLESLSFDAVTSPDFSTLKACKKIRTLQLRGRPCIINDADVGALVVTWPDLEHLTLGENNNPAPITDPALEELVKLKNLKELKLTETQVSAAALAKLQKALPGCTVTK